MSEEETETSAVEESESEAPPPVQETVSNGTATENQEELLACKLFCRFCKFALQIYGHKYNWEKTKATFMFILAWMLTQECHAMVLPLKEYEPFQK